MRRFSLVTFLLLPACYTQNLEVADGGIPCVGADCGSGLTCCAGVCLSACDTATGTAGTSASGGTTSGTLSGTTTGTTSETADSGIGAASTTGSAGSAGTTSSGTTSGGLTLEIRPNPGAFGSVGDGQSSSQIDFTVENLGTTETGALSITISGNNAGDFIEGVNTCNGFSLDPSSTCSVFVTFWPSTTGSETATLTASANPGGQATAALTGTGT